MKQILFRIALMTISLACINTVFAQQEATVNPSPFVIPALREWKGSMNYFEWPKNVKLVVDPSFSSALRPVAELFAEDLRLLSPDNHPKVQTGKASSGDVYFTLRSTDSSLPAEGYILDISDRIRIDAKDSIGAIWATRSLLQMLEQDQAQHRIPKGVARDYPKYAVRGFVLDVARKFFTIDFLKNYVKFMSYYKMNDFQIHLSDNGFKDFFGGNWDSTYAAFRLENTTYPNLTAKDGSYSKEEFIALQQMAQHYGVNIVPEIDVPAHSLAFSKAVPGIGSKVYGQDHLDLNNPLTYTVVDNVFKEYLQGPNPVFIGKEVHIGTDEYDKKEAEKFRAFTDHYIRFVESYGKKVRMWGSLTHAPGSTPVKVEDVTMNLWYNGYADPKAMFNLGYKGISTPDGWLYIVPAAGYYYDYLNTKKLYEEWTPNMIGDQTFDENYPLLRGGSFAVWNDHVGNGITEKDVHHRVFPAMQVLSQKMWGGSAKPISYADFAAKCKQVGEGPGLNMLGRFAGKDSLVFSLSKKEIIINVHHANFEKANEELELKGDNSYLETNIAGIGYDYAVSFLIKPSKNNLPDAVLFSSKDAVVVLNMHGCGKPGFTREGYSYSFNYILPADAWTHLTIKGNNKGTSLYVNGILAEKLEGAKKTFANGKQIAKVQTLFFPLQYIGSNSNACKALISNLEVFNRELDDETIKHIAEEVKSKK